MAVVCFGLLTVSLVQDLFYPSTEHESSVGLVLVKGMQFGMPVLLGGLLCTGKRWAMMVGVAYGTIGLALDIATFVQSVTGETDTLSYLALVGLTGLMNFLLILLGGTRNIPDSQHLGLGIEGICGGLTGSPTQS